MFVLKSSLINIVIAKVKLEKMWNDCKTYDDYVKTEPYIAIIEQQLKKYDGMWLVHLLKVELNRLRNEIIWKTLNGDTTTIEQPKPHRDMYWKV